MNFAQIRHFFSKNQSTLMVVLFILAFSYIFFFTQCVPFFFDDHEFNRGYVPVGYTRHLLELFSLNTGDSIFDSRPVYGIYFVTAFSFFGYDYCAHRFIKAILFGFCVLVFYSLAFFLFKRKSIAFTTTLVIMTYFPIYIQIFGYAGPHIFAEAFKMLAMLFFLFDITQEKSSGFRQFLVLLFALLAMRSYSSSYAIAAILPLFTLFYQPKKFLRYSFLFFLLFLIQFPLGAPFAPSSITAGETFMPKLINIKHVFLNQFFEYITSPVPHYNELYYKPAIAILTFFGFWLFVFAFLILLMKKCNFQLFIKYFCIKEDSAKQQYPKLDAPLIIILSLVWIICELPAYIFLPEHAIRYVTPLLFPFSFFIVYTIIYAFEDIAPPYKKVVTIFTFFCIAGIILTNLFYVYAFRAGWGSSFIVFEEVMDTMALQHEKHGRTIGVLYNAGSVAEEYKYVNKSSTDYSFGEGITYIKAATLDEFSEEKIKEYAMQYGTFYVLKRITSISKTSFPQIALEEYSSLEEVSTLYGINLQTFFDRVTRFLMNILNISYEPNKVIIYQYSANENSYE